MPSLYNAQTQKWETIPDNQVEQAIKTGVYSFPKSYTNIPMYDATGEKVRVTADDFYDALTLQGYSYRTQQMREAEQDEAIARSRYEKYGGYDYIPQAFAVGALSGITSSLSDWGIRGATELIGGDVDEELAIQRQIQAQHPIASTIGQITGTIGGVLMGIGPASLAAKTASKLGMSGAAKVGSLLPQKYGVSKAGQWLGQRAIEGAVADSLYEAGRISSDLAYKDPNVTLENAMGRLGTAALTGAAFDVGLGAIGKALVGTKNAILKGVDKFQNAVNKSPMTAKAITKAFSLGKGWSDEVKDAFEKVVQDPNLAKRVVDSLDQPIMLYDDVADAIQNVKKSSQAISYDVTNIRNQASKAEDFTKRVVTQGDRASATKTLKQSVADALSPAKEQPYVYGAQMEAAMTDALQSTIARIDEAGTTSQLFDAVKKGQDYIFNLGKKAGDEGSKQVADAYSKAYNGFKKVLNDEKIFGNYAKIHADFNKPISNFLNVYKRLFGTVKGNKVKRGLLTINVPAYGKPVLVADPTRIKSIVTSPRLNPTNRETWDLIEQLDEHVDMLIKKAEEPVLPTDTPDLIKFKENIQNNLATYKKAKQQANELVDAKIKAQLINSVQTKTGAINQNTMLGYMGGQALNSLTGVPGLGFMGAAVSTVLSRPMTVMRVAAGLHRAETSFLNKLDSSVTKFFTSKPISSTIRYSGYGVFNKFSNEFDDNEIDTKAKPEQKAIRLIQRYNEDPNKVVSLINRSIPQMTTDDLDEIRTASLNITSRMMQFLGSKIPEADLASQMFGKDVVLDSTRKLEIQKYIEVAMNPGLLVKQIENGSIDSATVDTVKTIYPEMYDTIRMKVLNKLTDPKTKVDYSKKLQLAILFEAPLTGDLQKIDMLQQFNQEFPGVEPEQAVSQAPLPTGSEYTRSQQLGA